MFINIEKREGVKEEKKPVAHILAVSSVKLKKIHETNSSHSLIVHINVKCHLNDNGGMGVSNLHVNKPPCKRCM